MKDEEKDIKEEIKGVKTEEIKDEKINNSM